MLCSFQVFFFNVVNEHLYLIITIPISSNSAEIILILLVISYGVSFFLGFGINLSLVGAP